MHWEDVSGQEVQIPYDGIPFIICGYDVRECQFGPDRNLKKKKTYKMEKSNRLISIRLLTVC